MPRRAVPPTTLLGRVRAHFGLSQAELALYLAASPELVNAVEAGRRRLTGALWTALEPLARQLPDPPPAATSPPEILMPTAPPPGLPPPDAAGLDFRRRVCRQQAARIEKELAQLARQGRTAQHWAQALPALLQAATDAPAPDPDRAAWLLGWLRRQGRPLPPEAATRWHLLQARRVALQAEIASLDAA